MDDTADLEVVKVAAAIVKRLQSFLDKYHYMEEVGAGQEQGDTSSRGSIDSSYIKDHSNLVFNAENGEWNNADLGMTPKPTTTTTTPHPSKSPPLATSSSPDQDGVIDSIVDAQDVNLLATAYENQLQVDRAKEAEGSTQIAEDYYKQFAVVSPGEFLRKVYALDLEKLAENRSTWIAQIENFESLLDDILLGFDEENLAANDADCY